MDVTVPENTSYMKSYVGTGLVVGVATVMVASMVLGVIPGALNVGTPAAHPAPAAAPAAPVPTVDHPVSFAATPAGAHVKGTVNVYEVAPAGANTMDPSVAYDTVSYEPILNVYQTLINYNGSSTATFVPTLATCVPGTPQCMTDYASNLTGYVHGTPAPVYWTFAIDPSAHFYDNATKKSWGVYPSDVVFSLARTLAFADLPYAGKNPGWIIAQSLLPFGSGGWDSGWHSPFNNTPQYILNSMLVNDSAYCPAKALHQGHGCVTFVANGSGSDWPFFLQLVADNLGASVVPCGWFTAQSAGITGWAGTHAAGGDGPCLLPDGGNTTNDSAWTTYVAGLSPTAWDTFELLAENSPQVQPGVRWAMVGSGPYYAGVVEGIGYELRQNPAYVQPSGCSGAGSLATYTGYCDPAPSSFIHNVNVYWEPDDSFGISQYRAGAADFAGIESVHTTTLLQLAAAGDLDYTTAATISDAFTPIDLSWSPSEYASQFPSQPLQHIPTDFFTNLGLREFYVHAYPYTTIENTIRTVDGIQYEFNAGGAIPIGMGSYYPGNVSFPVGDPDTNPSDVGGAAWWWAQITNPSSTYYDPELAGCSVGTPCTWAIAGLQGDPADDQAIADWIGEIKTLSGGVLQPFGGASFDLTFDQFLNVAFTSAYNNPLVSETGTGWAPDYPDPTDYTTPMLTPDATYTASTAFSQQVGISPAGWAANNTTCGHNVTNLTNLVYWAHAAENLNGTLNSTCQGVAYGVANGWLSLAAGLPTSPDRILDYNLIEQITNALSMYVWNGQTNTVLSAAPWIELSSVNSNPMIGGGADQVWFQVRYAYTSTVTFSETGLTSGTPWSVTFGPTTQTSSTSTIAFSGIANGTYDYSTSFVTGYGVTPANGTLTISGATTQDVTFTPFSGATYATTFTESGLISNTTWSVIIPTVGTASGASTSLVFTLPAGAYTYQPGVIPGYGGGASGTVTVATSPQTVDVSYSSTLKPVYAVTFTSAGLPAGSSWSVTLSTKNAGDYTQTTTASALVFQEFAGNYTATFGGPSGYKPASPTQHVAVNGTTSSFVPFSSTASTSSPSPTYLSKLAYELIAGLAVLAVVGFGLAAYAAFRRPPTSPPPKGWSEDAKPSETSSDESAIDSEPEAKS